jgi:hypothetical protein
MSLAYILTESSLTVFTPTGPLSIYDNLEPAIQAIKDEDWDRVVELVSPIVALSSYCLGSQFEIRGSDLYFNGEPQHSYIATRILAFHAEGISVEPLVNFAVKLQQNPSKRVNDQLYEFLERGKLPITPDGDFLAYRTVRPNYYDWHSNTIDNRVGKKIEIPRNTVCDDKEVDCGAGLHVCSMEYLNQFHTGEGRIVVVRVNPADVVSVPSSCTLKARVCKYEVIAELDVQPTQHNVWGKSVVNDYDEDGYDEDGYDEDGYDEDGYNRNGLDRDGE